MNTTVKVWFHRARAITWVLIGVVSFPLGWANSVVLVWIASVYANSLTDWGAAEAADDRTVMDALDAVRADQETLRGELGRVRELLEHLVNRPPEGDLTDDQP